MHKKDKIKKFLTPFFLIIFLFLLFFYQVFFPKKMIYKSKATQGASLILTADKIEVRAGEKFILTIKMISGAPILIQSFKINLNFDPENIEVKENGINYLVGQPSNPLGADTNQNITAVNNNGVIKLYSEITNPAEGLLVANEIEIGKINFIAKKNSSFQIITNNSSYFKVNNDYTISPLAFAETYLNFNQKNNEITNTSSDKVKLNLKIKFQGILKPPPNEYQKMNVRIIVKNEITNVVKTEEFTFSGVNFWQKNNILIDVPEGLNYTILIKGPKHIQKKICDQNPSESRLGPGTYTCSNGKISLKKGINDLDFSGILLLVGDLPVGGAQDGVVNSLDTSFIRNNLGSRDKTALAIGDLNLDGIIDSQDWSLIIAALSVKGDEE